MPTLRPLQLFFLAFLVLHLASLGAPAVAAETAHTPLAARTAAPTLTPTPITAPQQIEARCNNPPCGGGVRESALQAATVTSTIVQVSEVPCYVTEYVTNEQTVRSTVYETQTVTSTVTRDGTVFVVQYSPTPVLRSSQMEQVVTLKVTQTIPTYWLESTGSAYRSTERTEYRSVGGGVSGPSQPQPQPQPQPNNPQPAPQPQQPGQAWTQIGGGGAGAAPTAQLPCGDGHCAGEGWKPDGGQSGYTGQVPPYLSQGNKRTTSRALLLSALCMGFVIA